MTHNNYSINNIPLTNEQIPITFLPELQRATGRYDYPMTNDYIFRAVLQTNNLALKGLISALLRIPPEHILSVEIANPILLGDHYEAKEFRTKTSNPPSISEFSTKHRQAKETNFIPNIW